MLEWTARTSSDESFQSVVFSLIPLIIYLLEKLIANFTSRFVSSVEIKTQTADPASTNKFIDFGDQFILYHLQVLNVYGVLHPDGEGAIEVVDR